NWLPGGDGRRPARPHSIDFDGEIALDQLVEAAIGAQLGERTVDQGFDLRVGLGNGDGNAVAEELWLEVWAALKLTAALRGGAVQAEHRAALSGEGHMA